MTSSTLGYFSGLGTLLRTETSHILRAPAMWVLAGVVAFSALLAPPTARYMTQILSAAVDPALAEALGSTLPDATWRESYAEWLNNLNQLTVFALIIVAAITLTGELTSGSAAFILTRHVGRSAYLTAKYLVFSTAFLVFTLTGVLMTWALSAMLFDAPPLTPLLTGTLVWWLGAQLILTVILLLVAITTSMAISAGAGFITYVALLLVGAWRPGASLNALATTVLTDTPSDTLRAGPLVLTTIVCCLVLLVMSLEIFKRKELH